MRFLWLKLAYAIEIGAYLAYVGHYAKSNDTKVLAIAKEELRHMVTIKIILNCYNKKPNHLFNLLFFCMGTLIRYSCGLFPKRLLDKVASLLEVLNVMNYNYMAKLFPVFRQDFISMEKAEVRHKEYFRSAA